MADQPPSASQQTGKTGKARNRRTPKAGSQRGPYSQEYHHFVNIAQSALLTESKRLEIKQKTGADVELGPDPSDKQKPKVVIIRGFRPFQIEAAARLINEETNTQHFDTTCSTAGTSRRRFVPGILPTRNKPSKVY